MTRESIREVVIPSPVYSLVKKISNIVSFKQALSDSLEEATTELVEIILGGAINLRASDIHLEPEEKRTRLRVRIDGLLEDVTFFPNQTYERILSRIKLLSGLKFNIREKPQDGRFSINFPKLESKRPIEVRTSTLPSEYGESLVLRILDPNSLLSLENLGLREDLLQLFKKEIKRPNGTIIVTGPTGSGKTTTLYAFLKAIESPEIKIITIEDPIEYQLEGISQTQVDPEKGYDFASGLRSIMRQDPDVILVGEIRDKETAKIALQAALTGHLVLTTLHTNDAPGTIARLLNLGADIFNIGPAINMVIAQRLVRRLCKGCTRFEKVSPQLLKKIKQGLANVPSNLIPQKLDENLKIGRAEKCPQCNFTGYRGRVGIFEAFLIDEQMEEFIVKHPSTAQIREEAIKRGMITMKEDGILKVLEGITTIEEVEKETGPI